MNPLTLSPEGKTRSGTVLQESFGLATGTQSVAWRTGVSLMSVVLLHAVALFAVVHASDYAPPMVSVPMVVSFATASEPVKTVTRPKPKPTPAPSITPETTPMPEEAADDESAPPEVIAPRFDAAYLNNPAPDYPTLSRRLGEQGRVMLRVFVGADGSAREVQVRTSSGWPRLDRSARETVMRWQFMPARRGGDAIGDWVLVPIVFSLTRNS